MLRGDAFKTPVQTIVFKKLCCTHIVFKKMWSGEAFTRLECKLIREGFWIRKLVGCREFMRNTILITGDKVVCRKRE